MYRILKKKSQVGRAIGVTWISRWTNLEFGWIVQNPSNEIPPSRADECLLRADCVWHGAEILHGAHCATGCSDIT